ncbi:MAG: hypothetical protein IT449_06745 [Phycisphaerales bacterium]|nr:hypothetical protein [Phycisphaerales bacterium]
MNRGKVLYVTSVAIAATAGCGDLIEDGGTRVEELLSVRCMIPDDDPTLQGYRGWLGDGERFHDIPTAQAVIQQGCDAGSSLMGVWSVGNCSGGKVRYMVEDNGGLTFATLYYDAACGEFLGYEYFRDGGTCNGWVDAWPDVVVCDDPQDESEVGCALDLFDGS